MTEKQFYRSYCAAMADLRVYVIAAPPAFNYGSVEVKTHDGNTYEVGAVARVGTTDEVKEKQRYTVLSSDYDEEDGAYSDDLLQVAYGRKYCGCIISLSEVVEVGYQLKKVI